MSKISIKIVEVHQPTQSIVVKFASENSRKPIDEYDGLAFNLANFPEATYPYCRNIQGMFVANGKEYGVTTGRRRKVNWLNINKLIEAIEVGGAVYYSIDKGVTWNRSTDPKMQNQNWSAVSVSANGQYQTVVAYGGSVYTCSLV